MRVEHLRQFIYAVPGLPKRERVAECIQTIEQNCVIVEERVALYPEFVNVKVLLPAKFPLPPGVISTRHIGKGNGDLVIDYNPGIWRNPSPKALLQLSKFSDVSITIELKKFKQTYRCRLTARNSVCGINIELRHVTGVAGAGRIENLQRISELLGLPVEFSPPTQLPTGCGGAKVAVAYLETDTCSAELRCDLSQKQFADVLGKLVAESKGKIDCWRVEDIGVVPFPTLALEVNRVGFPCKRTEMTYTWRLQSYKDFAALTEMAARNEYGEVMQSLFEFEFGKNKRGQLDTAAAKNGGFKLWFSFDAKEDQEEFTQLTGIKLKEEH